MFNASTISEDNRLSRKDIIQVTVVIIQIILSLIGNGVIFYVIYSNRNLRTLRNLFTASLAASDFLLACTDMVSVVADKLSSAYPGHVSVCYIILLSGVLFSSASVFSLTAMSVNRYVAISFPLHYHNYVTPTRSKIILFLIWLTAFALAIPPMFWRPAGVVCNATTPSDSHFIYELLYMVSEWLFWFLLPGTLISFTYYRIFVIARRQARQIAASEVTNATNFVTSDVRSLSLKEKKAGRMVTLLMGFWLLCWLPFFTVLTIHKFVPNFVPSSLMATFVCLMFCNSAGNPFILTVFNKEMKAGVRRFFCKSRIRHELHGGNSTGSSQRNTHRMSVIAK